MFAKHNPTYFTFDVKCCEKSFYYTNYGVIQGFPALRKAVTTHVEKYFFPIMLHNLVKTQRFKQTNFNSVTKCTAVRFSQNFHRKVVSNYLRISDVCLEMSSDSKY